MALRHLQVAQALLHEAIRTARDRGRRGVVFIHFDPESAPTARDIFFHDIGELQRSGYQGVPLEWQYRIQTYDERTEVIVGVLDIERLIGTKPGEPFSFFRMNAA